MSGDGNRTREEALATLLAHYASLRGLRSNLEPLALVRISVDSQDVGLKAIEEELDRLETGAEGWARRRSDFYCTPLGGIERREAGPLLRGEWALGAEKSVHVMHLGEDLWRRTEFTEGKGEPALALDLDLEPARAAGDDENDEEQDVNTGQVLRYRLYFCADDPAEGSIRERHARFCGFFERSQ